MTTLVARPWRAAPLPVTGRGVLPRPRQAAGTASRAARNPRKSPDRAHP